jgi:nitroreductase
MDTMEAIRQRRSVRKYLEDPVPDELIFEILDAARIAPSWANTQVSRYIVIKDAATKKRLSDTLPMINPARAAILEAPVVICLLAKRGRSGFIKGEVATDKGDWFMFDAGIAMEHLVLAAWSLGLGTCHVALFDARKVEEILGIPEGFSIVEMTPVGYFREMPRPTPRTKLQDIVYIDRFGESCER